eukprot:RCo013422
MARSGGLCRKSGDAKWFFCSFSSSLRSAHWDGGEGRPLFLYARSPAFLRPRIFLCLFVPLPFPSRCLQAESAEISGALFIPVGPSSFSERCFSPPFLFFSALWTCRVEQS